MSDSLQPYGLQHVSLPCPSLSSGVCSNSCPLNQWCHLPTISSSITPFSSCFQFSLALGSFPMSWLFTPDVQIIGASASASVLPVNIQGWFPLGLTGLISLLSKVFSVWKYQFFGAQPFFMVQLLHPYMTTGKAIALTIQTFVGKMMSLLFIVLSRFAIAFFPRNKIFNVSFNVSHWLDPVRSLIG